MLITNIDQKHSYTVVIKNSRNMHDTLNNHIVDILHVVQLADRDNMQQDLLQYFMNWTKNGTFLNRNK